MLIISNLLLTNGSAVTGRRHQPIREGLEKQLKKLKSLAGQQ